jgi:transcriptional regulator with XRE-family HTH domain
MAKLTQTELAEKSGLTQPVISRLERMGVIQRVPEGVIRLLAQGLAVDLKELVGGTMLEKLLNDDLDEDAGVHLVYCANPFCPRNEILAWGSDFELRWKSAEQIGSREFDALRYCGACKSELVRACPHCGKRIRRVPEHYCSRCGKKVHDRPTKPEYQELCRRYGKSKKSMPHLAIDAAE